MTAASEPPALLLWVCGDSKSGRAVGQLGSKGGPGPACRAAWPCDLLPSLCAPLRLGALLPFLTQPDTALHPTSSPCSLQAQYAQSKQELAFRGVPDQLDAGAPLNLKQVRGGVRGGALLRYLQMCVPHAHLVSGQQAWSTPRVSCAKQD